MGQQSAISSQHSAGRLIAAEEYSEIFRKLRAGHSANFSSGQSGKPKRSFRSLSLLLLTLALRDFLMSSALCFSVCFLEPVITLPFNSSSTISVSERGRFCSCNRILVALRGS